MFFEERGDSCQRELNLSSINEEKDFVRIASSDVGSLLALMQQIQTRSSRVIQIKLNEYLENATSACLSFLICPRKLTTDYIIMCIGTVAVEPPIFVKQDEWRAFQITLEKRGFGPVAFKASCMDQRLKKLISPQLFEKTGKELLNFLMIPCFLPNTSKPQLFAVLINTSETSAALSRDLSLVGECSRYCAATLRNTMVAEEMKDNHEKLKMIISGIDEIAKHFSNYQELITGLKRTMEKVLDSTVSSIFLKEDKFLVSRSLDYGYPLDLGNELQLNDLKIPLGVGLTGLAGTFGEVFESNDPSKEKVYCNVPSTSSHFKNVLSFPFFFQDKIIGVGEVYDKTVGNYNETDKLQAMVIGRVFGPIMQKALQLRKDHSSLIIKEIVASQLGTRKGIRREDESEVNRVKLLYKTAPVEEFGQLDFLPSNVPSQESIVIVMAALNRINILDTLEVQIDELIRFLMYQRNHQKSFPFRNWFHSFSAFQFLYSIFLNFGLMEEWGVTDIEALAMLLATLCNGCDYRGPTHRFQSEAGTVLGSVYSSPGSRNEIFAINQSLETMINPEYNFLASSMPERYKEFLLLFDEMILNTDLAEFVNKKEEFDKLKVESKSELSVAVNQKATFYKILMVCSKLSDHTRSWEHTMEIGVRLCKEFYRYPQQKTPTSLFRHAVSDTPLIRVQLQSQIIKELCIPAFQILQKLLPTVQDHIQNLNQNVAKLNNLLKEVEKEEWAKSGEDRDRSISVEDAV